MVRYFDIFHRLFVIYTYVKDYFNIRILVSIVKFMVPWLMIHGSNLGPVTSYIDTVAAA